MNPVFVDTSAWFMVTSAATIHHAHAVATLRQLAASNDRLVTTNLVLGELHRLTLIKANRRAARSVLDRILGTPRVDLVHADRDDFEAALGWIDRFSDQDFTLTDATSFAVMHRLSIRRAFAFDRDFSVAGFDLVS